MKALGSSHTLIVTGEPSILGGFLSSDQWLDTDK